jgi:hypothetical protein
MATRQVSTALSSGSSSSDFLLIDALPTSDDCVVTKLNRRAFIHDIISKSFPAPPQPLTSSSPAPVVMSKTDEPAGSSESADLVVISQHANDDEDEEEETLCLDSDLGDIGQSPLKTSNNKRGGGDEEPVILSSSAASAAPLRHDPLHLQTLQQLRQRLLGDEEEDEDYDAAAGHNRTFPFDASVARLISDDVWPRVYRQFELDVRRQEFLIETEKFTNAADAYRSIRQMMHSTLVQKLLKERQRAALKKQRRLLSSQVAAKAWSLVSPMLGRTLDRWRRREEPHPPYHLDPVQDAQDDDALENDQVYSEELIEAAERMTRLVILLSQQSVMGLPFEELYRRYLVHVDRVLHLDSDAARNGAMFVQLTAAPSTAATTTSSASSELGGSAASVASSFASVNYPSPQQAAPRSSSSSVAGGPQPHMPPPPPPLFDWPHGKRPSQHRNALSTAPTLRIHKRFRVFEIITADDDDGDEDIDERKDAQHRNNNNNRRAQCDDDGVTHTLFTIDTDIIIDLFAPESVPIVMTWMIEQPSPRRVSTRTPTAHVVPAQRSSDAPRASPSMAEGASARDDDGTDGPSRVPPQDCLTYVPSSAHHRSISGRERCDAGGSETSSPQSQSRDDGSSRACDCLGGSYGFHRPQCHIVTLLRQK